MIVELIHQQDISVLNIYTPNIRVFKQRKKLIEFQGEINKPTIIIDFNTHLSIIVRVDRKISKNIQDLNSTLINIDRKPNSRIHIFFKYI